MAKVGLMSVDPYNTDASPVYTPGGCCGAVVNYSYSIGRTLEIQILKQKSPPKAFVTRSDFKQETNLVQIGDHYIQIVRRTTR